MRKVKESDLRCKSDRLILKLRWGIYRAACCATCSLNFKIILYFVFCLFICNSCSSKYYSDPLSADITVASDDSKKNVYEVCANPSLDEFFHLLKGKSVAVVCPSASKIQLKMNNDFSRNILQTLKNNNFNVICNSSKADIVLYVSNFKAVRLGDKTDISDKNYKKTYFHEYKANVNLFFRESNKNIPYVYTRPVVSEFESTIFRNSSFNIKNEINDDLNFEVKESLKNTLLFFLGKENDKYRLSESKDCFCVLYMNDFQDVKSCADSKDKFAPELACSIIRTMKRKRVCLEKFPDKADIIFNIRNLERKLLRTIQNGVSIIRYYEENQTIDIIDRKTKVKIDFEIKKKFDVVEKGTLIKKGTWKKVEKNSVVVRQPFCVF